MGDILILSNQRIKHMSILKEFMDGVLPGNYALTKSMELSRSKNSGTLWYMKKFIVWYYYIFLSGKVIGTKKYREEIEMIFSNYISDLPAEQQDAAKTFFFPDIDLINPSSEKFIYFAKFCQPPALNNTSERNKYVGDAKKYYFAFVMGSGGQGDTMKYIQSSLYDDNFEFNRIYDLNNKDSVIAQAIANNPKETRKIQGIYNDFHAFLRNERQILYYYGYFHAKSMGASSDEFSSLTPIGELAIRANSHEFQAIYEHQKLKMISQPVNVVIASLKPSNLPIGKFSISFSPYLDILNTLNRRGEITLDEYRFILSRKNENFSETSWVMGENELYSNIDIIKEKIVSFGRERDVKSEDGDKELKKYITGLRSDLIKDYGKNPLGICSLDRNKLRISSKNKLEKVLLPVYSSLNSYKILKYSPLFQECLERLREKYIEDTENSIGNKSSGVKADQKTISRWNYYMLIPDYHILLGVIMAMYSMENGVSFDDIATYGDIIKNNYPSLFAEMELTTVKRVKSEMKRLKEAIISGDFSIYLDEESHNTMSIKCLDIINRPGDDLFAKIMDISNESLRIPVNLVEGSLRERNSNLIHYMKAYYAQKYSEDGMLKCECCGNTTFLSKNNESYVEFHHIIPFNEAHGPDHYLNIVALCPNCHKKLHFINQALKKDEYLKLSSNNYMKSSIPERLKKLKSAGILKSYHIDYLFSEDAISQEDYDILISQEGCNATSVV